MTGDYFSDRERGPRARTDQEIRSPAWGGIVALINGAITNGGFGGAFPSECPDGRGITGTDFHAMGLAVRGEIPEISWPLDADREDKYLPSYLILARHGPAAFHVLFAVDVEGDNVRVVTWYRPDRGEWQDDMKTRRPKR